MTMTSFEPDTKASANAAAAAKERLTVTRRGVYLRDGFVLLALSLITVVLFGVTLFLFKSFEAHREALGRRWSERGEVTLERGNPEQAAAALRTALSYTPDDYRDQLLLAQALAGAGHLEAANNYFISLWEVHPGDGFVNLQLARLARRRGDAQTAVDYYRASIFGNWEQSGVERRREVRLELADYLVERGQDQAAQAELLIAASNAPEKDTALQLRIADHLQALGDRTDALHLYRQVAVREPHNLQAVADEGRAEFALELYPAAARNLTEAAELSKHLRRSPEDEQLSALAAQARRLPELSLSRDLPAVVRGQHISLDAGIAQRHLRSCTARLLPAAEPPNATGTAAIGGRDVALKNAAPKISPPTPAVVALLAGLHNRWIALSQSLNESALERDSELEDTVTQLIEDTELGLAPACGAPTGDDALLLGISRRAQVASTGATP